MASPALYCLFRGFWRKGKRKAVGDGRADDWRRELFCLDGTAHDEMDGYCLGRISEEGGRAVAMGPAMLD